MWGQGSLLDAEFAAFGGDVPRLQPSEWQPDVATARLLGTTTWALKHRFTMGWYPWFRIRSWEIRFLGVRPKKCSKRMYLYMKWWNSEKQKEHICSNLIYEIPKHKAQLSKMSWSWMMFISVPFQILSDVQVHRQSGRGVPVPGRGVVQLGADGGLPCKPTTRGGDGLKTPCLELVNGDL